MLKINKLYDLTAVGIKNVSMRMIGSTQKQEPEAVVAAIAALLLMVCRRYRIEVREVLDVTARIVRDAEEHHPKEMRAMARYLKEELPDA